MKLKRWNSVCGKRENGSNARIFFIFTKNLAQHIGTD